MCSLICLARNDTHMDVWFGHWWFQYTLIHLSLINWGENVITCTVMDWRNAFSVGAIHIPAHNAHTFLPKQCLGISAEPLLTHDLLINTTATKLGITTVRAKLEVQRCCNGRSSLAMTLASSIHLLTIQVTFMRAILMSFFDPLFLHEVTTLYKPPH
jgi:hypothetical protein